MSFQVCGAEVPVLYVHIQGQFWTLSPKPKTPTLEDPVATLCRKPILSIGAYEQVDGRCLETMSRPAYTQTKPALLTRTATNKFLITSHGLRSAIKALRFSS